MTAKAFTSRWRLAGIAIVIAVAGAGYGLQQRAVDGRLLRTDPPQILRDPELLGAAVDRGRPLYQKHCASCHGLNFQGDQRRGVPNLAKHAWLYGNDPVDVERTILYGIRSGHPKARNVTDMPAEVRTGQITIDDAHDVVEFLQKLSGAPHDETMAARGSSIYRDKGNCYDCHADDARGVIDYGTPALLGPVWLYGGDRETLFQTVLNGRHGICPAWINRLRPAQIRALAVYMVSATDARPDAARN